MTNRKSCIGCIHRRPLSAEMPKLNVCHYLIDTGEPRRCPPESCTHWREGGTDGWHTLMDKLLSREVYGNE